MNRQLLERYSSLQTKAVCKWFKLEKTTRNIYGWHDQTKAMDAQSALMSSITLLMTCMSKGLSRWATVQRETWLSPYQEIVSRVCVQRRKSWAHACNVGVSEFECNSTWRTQEDCNVQSPETSSPAPPMVLASCVVLNMISFLPSFSHSPFSPNHCRRTMCCARVPSPSGHPHQISHKVNSSSVLCCKVQGLLITSEDACKQLWTMSKLFLMKTLPASAPGNYLCI